jgi:hypothetical protein
MSNRATEENLMFNMGISYFVSTKENSDAEDWGSINRRFGKPATRLKGRARTGANGVDESG